MKATSVVPAARSLTAVGPPTAVSSATTAFDGGFCEQLSCANDDVSTSMPYSLSLVTKGAPGQLAGGANVNGMATLLAASMLKSFWLAVIAKSVITMSQALVEVVSQ